jgi:glycosyltransferase involved in cell wall biosynthesis
LRWAFFCGRPILPAFDDVFAAGLGGTEQAILGLTEALAEAGHEVCVVGGAAAERRIGAVDWLPAAQHSACDVEVAINDAALLPGRGSVRIVWFHNEVEFFREMRKGRLPALWRLRPAAVFIGSEQARLASRALGLSARAIIPYGLPARVLAAAPAAAVPGPVAIFTSQAYRGLADMIALWRSDIAPHLPAARFRAYVAERDVPAYAALAQGCPAITVEGRIANDAVLETLREARLLLAPGHRSETFCMAAAEAVAMGVPVVTLGIGSLKERVRHGVDGFVCRDFSSMAERTHAVLTDDALWRRLHDSGLRTREGAGWGDAALRWEHFARQLSANPMQAQNRR